MTISLLLYFWKVGWKIILDETIAGEVIDRVDTETKIKLFAQLAEN